MIGEAGKEQITPQCTTTATTTIVALRIKIIYRTIETRRMLGVRISRGRASNHFRDNKENRGGNKIYPGGSEAAYCKSNEPRLKKRE